MSYVMRASELVKNHIEVAKNYKTVYMWGCFGSPVTDGIITEKAKQYPDWYDAAKQARFRGLIGKGYFGFDCVNLTKGILWGWNGNKNAYHGGARYAGNAVPDVSADGMIAKCKDVSASGWDKLVPGEGLWMPGHWGMYIGDGLAVECTPIWDNGVQITCVGNIGIKGGPAPVRHYDLDEGLLDAVLKGEINPGRVFTAEYDLDHIQDAYEATKYSPEEW